MDNSRKEDEIKREHRHQTELHHYPFLEATKIDGLSLVENSGEQQ
jgi:hypothetical protein